MTDRELMQHMLEVLNRNDYLGWQVNIPIITALRERLAQPEQAFDCPRCGHCCSLPDPMPLFDDWGVDWNQCPPCNQKCNQGRDCPNA